MVEQTTDQQMEEVLNVTGDDPLSDAMGDRLVTQQTSMLADVAGKDDMIYEPDQKLDYKDAMGLLFPVTPNDPIFEDIKTMFEKEEYGSGVLTSTLTALAMIPGFGALPKATAKKIARETAESLKKSTSEDAYYKDRLSGRLSKMQLTDSEKPITSLNTYELPNEYFDPQTNEVIFSFDEGINTREYLFPNSRMYTSKIEKQVKELPSTVDTGYFKKFVDSIPSDQARNLGLVNLLDQATKKGDKKITKEDIIRRVNNNRFILTDTIYKFKNPDVIESNPFGHTTFSTRGIDKIEAVAGEPQFLEFSETGVDIINIAEIMGAKNIAGRLSGDDLSPAGIIGKAYADGMDLKDYRKFESASRPYVDNRFYKEILVGTPLAQKARPLSKEEIDQGFYIDVMGKTRPVTEAMKNMREPMVPMVTRKDFKNFAHYGKSTDIDITPIVHVRLYNNVIKSADGQNPDSNVRRTIVSEIQSDIAGGGKIKKDEVNPDTGISKKVETAYGITEKDIALDRKLKSENLKRDKLLGKIKGSLGFKRGDLSQEEYDDLLSKINISKKRLEDKYNAFPLKTLPGIPEEKRRDYNPQIVPDIPVVGRKGKIPQWSTLGVKRAIKDAVDHNSDEILFATDLVQEIRYGQGIGEGTRNYYARVLPQTIEKIGKENNINLNLRKENVQVNQFSVSNQGARLPGTLIRMGTRIAEYEKDISKGLVKFPWLDDKEIINITKIMKTVGRLSKELEDEYAKSRGSVLYTEEQSKNIDNLTRMLIDAIDIYGERHPFVFNMQYWVIDVTPELRKLFKQDEVSDAIDFNKGGIVQDKMDNQMSGLFGEEQVA